MSFSRASTSRCFSLCGGGMYSSLDTIWVGTGDGNDAASAGSNWASCSSDRNFILSPPEIGISSAIPLFDGEKQQDTPVYGLRRPNATLQVVDSICVGREFRYAAR